MRAVRPGAREDPVTVPGSEITTSLSARVTLPDARDARPGKDLGSHPRDRNSASFEFVLALIARGKR